MIWHDLVILLPCQSLEDLRLTRNAAESDELLAAWSGLYHPAVLARCGTIPRWTRATDPPQGEAGRLIVVPRCCEPLLPPDWLFTAETQSATIVRDFADRPGLLRTVLAQMDELPPELDPELTADHLALGFCRYQVEILTRQLRYMSNLDEPRFRTETLAAAQAAVEGKADEARRRLQSAFDLLAQAREYFYPVEGYLLDLTLAADSLLGEPLRSELAAPGPTNLLVTARLAERMAADEPSTLQLLRAGLDANTTTLVGGEYDEIELPLLGVEAILAHLQRALEEYQRHLGARPTLFGRRRFGLSPVLPQILRGLGFEGALHFTLDDGRFPTPNQSKIRWEGAGGATIESLARVPMDASRPESFLKLAEQLGRTLDLDQAATGVLAHWPGHTSPWYGDLKRATRYGKVLGRFLGMAEYFRSTQYVGQAVGYPADQYRSPYLEQAVAESQPDPISRWMRYHRRRAVAETLSGLAFLADLLGPSATEGPPPAELTAEVDATLTAPPAESLDDRLSDAVRQTTERFAAQLPRSTGPAQEQLLVANPTSFPRQAWVDVSGLANPPTVEGAVKFAEKTEASALAAVDVPAMGFAWVVAGPPKPAEPAPPRGKKTAQPPPLAEENTLRNEFCEVRISPITGGIQGIYGVPQRGNRLGQQLALRSAERRAAGDGGEPDDEDHYSVMAADEVRITAANQALGRIVARGRLVDRRDGRIAGFEQTVTLRRGSRIVEIDIALDPGRLPEAKPWSSHYAARFAWSDETAELHRGVNMLSEPTNAPRLESPYFIEVRSGRARTTILTAGLPYHRRRGERKLDSLLIVAGETARRFRLGVGIDLAYPVAAAVDFLAPQPVLATHGKPPAALSGWLMHVDSKNVVATHWAPLVTEGRLTGFRTRLLETEGRSCRTRVRSFRGLAAARQTDLAGQSPTTLPIDDDLLTVELKAHEWV